MTLTPEQQRLVDAGCTPLKVTWMPLGGPASGDRTPMALPPFAQIQEAPGGWAAKCLACPMTIESRPTVEQAVQDAHDHWQVWHSTKEERA